MQTGPCPCCQQLVRFPQRHPDTAVRCPVCNESFLLRRFLENLPPEVEVLEEGQPPGREPPGDEPKLSEAEPRRPFDFRDTLPIPEGAPPEIVAASRPVKKTGSWRRRSLGSELAKIALGGLIGALLAQLILWWLPRPWRRDPLDLAPRLPTAFSLLAPADLRRPQGNRPQDVLAGPNRDQGAQQAGAAEVAGASHTGTGQAADGAADPTGPRSVRPQGSVDGPALARALAEAREATGVVLASASPAPEAVDRWGTAVGQLAQAITLADASDPRVVAQAKLLAGLVVAIGQSEQHREMLAQWQRPVLSTPADARVGVLVFGRVEAVRPQGARFVTHLDAPSGPLRVLSHRDPTQGPDAPFQVGDRVGILGVLVSEPPADAEADGGEDPVRYLWGGFPARLPPATTPPASSAPQQPGSRL